MLTPTFHDTNDDSFHQDRWAFNVILLRNAALDGVTSSAWIAPTGPTITSTVVDTTTNELVYAFTDKDYIRGLQSWSPFTDIYDDAVPGIVSGPHIFGARASGQGSGTITYTAYNNDWQYAWDTGPVGAFGGYRPTLQDDFNRANESPMAGNWTTRTSYSSLDLVSNMVQCTGSSDCMAYWNTGNFGPNCAASIDITGWYTVFGASDGGHWYIDLCCSGTLLSNSYSVELAVNYTGAPILLNLRRRGSWIQSCSLSLLPANISTGDTLGLAVNGRNIEAWFRHGGTWVKVAERDDAALSGTTALPAGRAAIGGVLASGLGPNVKFDNFRAGDFSPDPQPAHIIMSGLKPSGGTPTQADLVTSSVSLNNIATPTMPSTILAGDLALCHFGVRQANASNPAIATPTGWTLIARSPWRSEVAYTGGVDQFLYVSLPSAVPKFYATLV